jgi:hypothetical protein
MLLLLELERRCSQLLCSVPAWSHIVQKKRKFSAATKAIGFHQNLRMLLLAAPTSNKQFNSSVKHGTEIYKLSVQEKFLLGTTAQADP